MTSHPFPLQITTWHESSYSLSEDSFCVEVARFSGDRTEVRDSKVPDGPVLLASPQYVRRPHQRTARRQQRVSCLS
ncbi:DUF397 domain-containing protein [Streptomyces sp. NPDC127117]|uniref:DUF397 domain-containing protein n=1 Tax=Streptomyces sp. NPDC127117 TaxID=3345368 RepID=UPI00362ED0A5